jgi:lipase
MASPLFVSRFGTGEPIVALHGIEAHGVRYVGLATYVDGFHIVAPDLRGHGRSPRIGPFTLEQHVADLMPIVEELGAQTTLLGHSYGGLIAWEIARAAPDAIKRLVLVDPAMTIDVDFGRYRAAEALALVWPDRVSAFSDMVAGREASAHWSIALDVAVGLDATSDGNVKEAVSDEAVRACWLEQLPRPLSESTFRGPTLLLEAGQENGAFLTPTALAELKRQLGENLQHEVLDLPHTITADGPDILATRIRKFVA